MYNYRTYTLEHVNYYHHVFIKTKNLTGSCDKVGYMKLGVFFCQ